MPAAKGLHTYPEQLWDICQSVSVQRREFVIECSRREALNVRSRFYGFRKALQRAEHDPTLTEALKFRAKETLHWSWDVVPYIDGPGEHVKLRFMHKDNTPMAKILARGLTTAAQVPSKSDALLIEEARKLLEDKPAEEGKLKTERDYG